MQAMRRGRIPLALVLFTVPTVVAKAAPVAPPLEEFVESLPFLKESASGNRPDWLIDGSPYAAGVYRSRDGREIVLQNGLIRRTFRISPNGATVGLDDLVNNQSLLRGVKSEAVVTLNGREFDVGGLLGQPNFAYLRTEWLDSMAADPAAMQLVDAEIGEPIARFAWKQVRRHAPVAAWPPRGASLRMDYALPTKAQDATTIQGDASDGADAPLEVLVSVHYELYDGLPAMCKWIAIHNQGDQAVAVDRFSSELLAVVEHDNWVETRDGVSLSTPRSLHVETDFAFGGFNWPNANRHVVHWQTDPQYTTQVNYLRQQPCLLKVSPTYGPAQEIQPGDLFESCRAFELVYDSTERERRGLALRRMYRTIAPWVTENPLMHHMRDARPELVRNAIDQAAEVGFEMVILSFGSGFDMEKRDEDYLAQWKSLAAHAHEKGVELGGYSLLSSRRIGGGNDIVSPAGESPTHGNCPALTSAWGQKYFQTLRDFFETTEFDLLEHDGSYPGDVDITPRPPLQMGEQDSQWAQWRIIADFYQWLRGRGVYLNVPDYYFLTGANKCGMGYREVNWSLPRAMQVLHTRQNIYDGTWTKTPSMGWMFVPLSEYHGGGPAATIEPLAAHLEHYEQMIMSNLALGVQACYRGPRLYDADETRTVVKRCVDWYKQHRDILESDVIHGRRADGRDVDWMLHVNPLLQEKGMLVAFNPLDEPAERTLRVNLYYTGLTDVARVRDQDGTASRYQLDRTFHVELPIRIPPGQMRWYVID